jgi:hypothetical protein
MVSPVVVILDELPDLTFQLSRHIVMPELD